MSQQNTITQRAMSGSEGDKKDRDRELDDKIRMGWGDTPPKRIPSDWRTKRGPAYRAENGRAATDAKSQKKGRVSLRRMDAEYGPDTWLTIKDLAVTFPGSVCLDDLLGPDGNIDFSKVYERPLKSLLDELKESRPIKLLKELSTRSGYEEGFKLHLDRFLLELDIEVPYSLWNFKDDPGRPFTEVNTAMRTLYRDEGEPRITPQLKDRYAEKYFPSEWTLAKTSKKRKNLRDRIGKTLRPTGDKPKG
jgi:hypothetical protein